MELNRKIPPIFPLKGVIQHYEWGGDQFIPHLIGEPNDAKRPFAELWMGAHPKAPSSGVIEGNPISLLDLIQASPLDILGKQMADKYNQSLPFLFKILDARKMLSIQAHPDKHTAREGFKDENKRSIHISAQNRNYKDENHKPEVHIALTDFWMLHGFRTFLEIETFLNSHPQLQPILSFINEPDFPDNESGKIRAVYKFIMELPDQRISAMLQPLLQLWTKNYLQGVLKKHQPEYWAARAHLDLSAPDGKIDRGIFSIFLMNLVHLEPGEGTFQDAGILHAYLEGSNVELMASSDNVLRGGLTPKHIDVPELLKILNFESGPPEILYGDSFDQNETIYNTPCDDFLISKIVVSHSSSFHCRAIDAPSIFIVVEGKASFEAKDLKVKGRQGHIFFTRPGYSFTITTDIAATLFRATVPI